MKTLTPFDNLIAVEVPIDAVLPSPEDRYWFKYKSVLLGCVTPTEIDFDVFPVISRSENVFRIILKENGIEIKEGYKLVILEKQ